MGAQRSLHRNKKSHFPAALSQTSSARTRSHRSQQQSAIGNGQLSGWVVVSRDPDGLARSRPRLHRATSLHDRGRVPSRRREIDPASYACHQNFTKGQLSRTSGSKQNKLLISAGLLRGTTRLELRRASYTSQMEWHGLDGKIEGNALVSDTD